MTSIARLYLGVAFAAAIFPQSREGMANSPLKRAPSRHVETLNLPSGLVYLGRVEDWRRCSLGSAYLLLPVSVGSASLSEP